MAKLTFILDDGQEIDVPLPRTITVGRKEGNDVMVNDPRIANSHAVVSKESNGHYLVRDLSATGATFLNGQQIDQSNLTHGDKLSFGPLKCVFHHETPVPAEAPPLAAATVASQSAPVSTPALAVDDSPPLSEENAAIQAQLKTWMSELSVAKRLFREANENHQALQRQRHETTLTLQKEQDHLAALFEQIRHTREDLTREEDKLRTLAQERIHAESVIQPLRKDAAEAQSAAEATSSLLESLTSQFHARKVEFEELSDNLARTTTALNSREKRVSELQAEESRLANIAANIRDSEAKQKEADASLSELESQIRLYRATLADLKDQAQKERANLQEIRQEEETLTDSCRSSVETLAKTEQLVEDAKASYNLYITQIERNKVEQEAQSEALIAAQVELQLLQSEHVAMEAKLGELKDTEQELEHCRALLTEKEAQQSDLILAVTQLSEQLEVLRADVSTAMVNLSTLQDETAMKEATVDSLVASLAEKRHALAEHNDLAARQIQAITDERLAIETELSIAQQKLKNERALLDETRVTHSNLQQECENLAFEERRVSELRRSADEKQDHLDALKISISALEASREELVKTVQTLESQEDSTRAKISTLRADCESITQANHALKEESSKISTRFEELRDLLTETESTHAKRIEQINAECDRGQRELTDLELKLTPVRQWQDEMEHRYAQLASLSEDTPEAMELWKEIEHRKQVWSRILSGQETTDLELTAPELQLARSVQTVLNSLSCSTAHSEEESGGTDTGAELATSTSASLPIVGQEAVLRYRLTRMRESIQREATRLDYLRQERAKEEARRQGPSPSTYLKEQERQLEQRLRRDEERHATLQRKIELSETEEERRRQRIAEMEHRLAELRSELAQGERDRNHPRQFPGASNRADKSGGILASIITGSNGSSKSPLRSVVKMAD